MKFKIGERFKVNNPILRENGSVIEITAQSGETNYYKTISGNTGMISDFGNASTFADGLTPVLNTSKILITSDATTTTACLYDGDKVIKSATAKYNPDDQAAGIPYSFETGARLAFDRLYEKTDKKSDASPKYGVGDKVKILANSNCHQFNIGDVVTLTHSIGEPFIGSKNYWIAIREDHTWSVCETDIEPYAEPSPFDWTAFKSGKIAVHCDTEDKAKAFLMECEDRGYKDRPTMWEVYKEETCYQGSNIDNVAGYSRMRWYQSKGYTIIDYPFTSHAVTREPIATLYCVKDGPGWLTKGKEYKPDHLGQVTYDNGCVGGPNTSLADYKKRNKSSAPCLFEEVKRPAKIGEYILINNITHKHYPEVNTGDIEKCINRNDGRAETDHHYFNDDEYVVLDGYKSEPEAEKFYNGRVVCVVKENDYLTLGKVYEFKNGFSFDDGSDKLPYYPNPVKSIEDLNSRMFSRFIELVEANS